MRLPITRSFATVALAAAVLTTSASNGQPMFAPTGFIPNKGQFVDQQGKPAPGVDFLFQGDGLHVQLRQGGFSYDTWHSLEPLATAAAEAPAAERDLRIHRIDIQLEGSDPSARWQPFEPATDVLNYYTTGTGEAGITDVHHYQRVLCRNIYPFIDLEFRTTDNERRVKYDFIIHPGGDPAMIRMRYSGARAELDDNAKAVTLSWDDGVLYDRVPKSYWRNGGKHEDASVALLQVGEDLFTYELKGAQVPWNEDRILVIDPVPDLQWGTYYGNGDHNGSLNALVIDQNGNTIAVGTAGLTGLASTGAYDQVLSGGTDALLVKLNSSGQRVWATYYGGSDFEFGNAVGVDANGVIYFAGETWSTGSIATAGAHQTALSGAPDAFLAKFNANGTRAWGTYYGGSGDDRAYALAVDGAGEPAIAGNTASILGIASSGAADASYGGAGDAFMAKFYATGVREWATYLGGSGADYGKGLGCDNTFFFLCGTTASTSGIALGATHQTTLNNGGSPVRDAYVVKYSGLGQKMWGTYFGGNDEDYGTSCFAELLTGNVYLAGNTYSTNNMASFGAHQGSNNGGGDGFLAKFNSLGTREWSTYVGGSNADVINAVSVGSVSRVILAGTTDSQTNIATAGSAYPNLAGSSDAFVNCFNSSGSRLWGTYYGGAGYDGAYALAVDGLDFAIGGLTGSSTNIATAGTFQSSATVSPGNYAKYVAMFTGPLFVSKIANAADGSPSLLARADASGFTLVLPDEVVTAAHGAITVRLVDAMGLEVLKDRISTDVTTSWFPWQGVASGAYTVIADTPTARWTTRVVRE